MVKKLLKALDEEWKVKQSLFKHSYFEIMDEFNDGISQILDPENIISFNFTPSHPDPLGIEMNENETLCRKYIIRLFELTKNDVINSTIISFFTSNISENNLEKVQENAYDKSNFLTKHILSGAWWFLLFTMINTISCQVKDCFVKAFKFGRLPLLSKFVLATSELNTDSERFEEESKRSSNKYVEKASTRNDGTISEASRETLVAVNIQMAVWVYMSGLIFEIKRNLKEAFGVDIPHSSFFKDDLMIDGDPDERIFIDFYGSAVFYSLIAGLISFTFAQFKHYMTRHSADADLWGKIIYFFACLFNSIAVFCHQICFFVIGLLFFTNILIVIIRFIVGFDEYDSMPKSEGRMITFLVFCVVLLPLKLIPMLVGRSLRYFSEEIVLRKVQFFLKFQSLIRTVKG